MRHQWKNTESQWNGQAVQRCAHCAAERTQDPSARSLYLYRRGRAVTPSRKPLGESWSAFKAGVVPACPDHRHAG